MGFRQTVLVSVLLNSKIIHLCNSGDFHTPYLMSTLQERICLKVMSRQERWLLYGSPRTEKSFCLFRQADAPLHLCRRRGGIRLMKL